MNPFSHATLQVTYEDKWRLPPTVLLDLKKNRCFHIVEPKYQKYQTMTRKIKSIFSRNLSGDLWGQIWNHEGYHLPCFWLRRSLRRWRAPILPWGVPNPSLQSTFGHWTLRNFSWSVCPRTRQELRRQGYRHHRGCLQRYRGM